jgi:Tfp pilus assembly protein PilF
MIQERMMEKLEARDLRGAAKQIEESIKVIKEENLEMTSAEVHESLARIYWAAGDRNLARHHVRKSVDLKSDWDYLEPRNRAAEVKEVLRTFETW